MSRTLIKNNSVLFGVFMSVLLIYPLRDLLLPHMLGKIYTAAKKRHPSVYQYCVITTLLVVGIQAAFVAYDKVDTMLYPRIMQQIRVILLERLYKMQTTKFEDVNAGSLLTRTIQLPPVLYDYIYIIKSTIIPNIVTIIATALYIGWKSRWLGALVALVIVMHAMFTYNVFTKCIRFAHQREKSFATMNSEFDDIIRNMKTVVLYNSGIATENERMSEMHHDFSTATDNMFKCTLPSKYVVLPVLLGLYVLVVVYGNRMVHRSELATSAFVTLLIVYFVLLRSVWSNTQITDDLVRMWVVIGNALQMFPLCETERPVYTKTPTVRRGIHFQDVSFSYGVKRIMTGMTLTFEPNKITAVVGGVGVGKSTLIMLMLCLQTPSHGEIFLDGVSYKQLGHERIRDAIMYMPQSPLLFNRSVYENIVYGLSTRPSKEEIARTMVHMGLGPFLQQLPDGLDTLAGVNGSSLSGGQRQIVWIVKANMKNHSVLVLDEPTASMDDDTKTVAIGLIHKLATEKGRIIVLVTHDPVLVDLADVVMDLEKMTHSSG